MKKMLDNVLNHTGLLPDSMIRHYAEKHGMIFPFVDHLVREKSNQKVLSYGSSSYGYDFRLSDSDFKIFRHVPGTVIDPKNFNQKNLETAELHEDYSGKYFILPGNSYGLGVTVEYIRLPNHISALWIGKSTYARCGLILNCTPAEAGWHGKLTLEFSNASEADIKIYALEGIAQAWFFEGLPCEVPYDNTRKYQGQQDKVVTAKV